jgi:hypothetical protein
VYVPFSRELSGLIKAAAKSVRLRRDFGQLLRGIKAHALLHRQHRRRRNNGSIIATVEEDYAAVRKLLADLLATASEMKMRKAVIETVEAVEDLGTGVKVRAIANKLKLDMSATYRRLQAAEQGGFIVNEEDRPRRPGKYKSTGEQLGSERVLPTVEDLLEAVENNRRKQSSFSPRSPSDHRKNVHSRRVGG